MQFRVMLKIWWAEVYWTSLGLATDLMGIKTNPRSQGSYFLLSVIVFINIILKDVYYSEEFQPISKSYFFLWFLEQLNFEFIVPNWVAYLCHEKERRNCKEFLWLDLISLDETANISHMWVLLSCLFCMLIFKLEWKFQHMNKFLFFKLDPKIILLNLFSLIWIIIKSLLYSKL